MFLFVLSYQNHIYNQKVCSWDDIELCPGGYGFDMLEQRETCFLMVLNMKVYAGGLNSWIVSLVVYKYSLHSVEGQDFVNQ